MYKFYPSSCNNRCSKIIPCPDAPHQTCGCKEFENVKQSVVYHIDTSNKGINIVYFWGFSIIYL